jgi:arylsulfatase A-like enzyme
MHTAFEAPGLFTEFIEEREDIGWRNRSAALMDLDDMIGEIMEGLVELGVLNETYVIFTSDNGYCT